jgi:hypothetical protein
VSPACVIRRPLVDSRQLFDYLQASEQSDQMPSDDVSIASMEPQLRSVQQLLLVILTDYWLVKYVVHRQAWHWLTVTTSVLHLFGPDDSCPTDSATCCKGGTDGGFAAATNCSKDRLRTFGELGKDDRPRHLERVEDGAVDPDFKNKTSENPGEVTLVHYCHFRRNCQVLSEFHTCNLN